MQPQVCSSADNYNNIVPTGFEVLHYFPKRSFQEFAPYNEQLPEYNIMQSYPMAADSMAVNSPGIYCQSCHLSISNGSEVDMALAPPPMEYYQHAPQVTTQSHQLEIGPHAPLYGLPVISKDKVSIIASSVLESNDEDDEHDIPISGKPKRGRLDAQKSFHGQARRYNCNQRNSEGHLCPKKYASPRHLRRHVKTSHSKVCPFRCKVSSCAKNFSRGDNMSDHYWTHIERGGRAGENEKMEMSKLFKILGPREKKLKRKLEKKLSEEPELKRRKMELNLEKRVMKLKQMLDVALAQQ
jgi:hypothetical protein